MSKTRFVQRSRKYVAFAIFTSLIISFVAYRSIGKRFLVFSKKTTGVGLNIIGDMTSQNVPQTKNIDLKIIVLTYNRPLNLQQCLDTVNGANYSDDNIQLDIWIDRPKGGNIHTETLKVANNFKFKHGTKRVFEQPQHAGIVEQWLHTWNTTLDIAKIGIYLEDDVIVSPYFYKWLKAAHKKYGSHPDVNGFSMQGQRGKHGGGSGNMRAPPGNIVYKYQIVGAWGFSPTFQKWKKFQGWYEKASQNKSFMPIVPNIEPSRWYLNLRKTGQADTMWTMWHIYHAYKYNEWTIYTSLPNDMGFTSNTKPRGVHGYDGSKPYPLVQQWNDVYIDFPDQPVRLDLRGNVIEKGEKT